MDTSYYFLASSLMFYIYIGCHFCQEVLAYFGPGFMLSLCSSSKITGVFLGVSSNTRYQIVTGLERLVEGSLLAKQIPPVSLAFTVGIRFANNVYAGMQFVDWARWSGVQ